MSDAIYLTRLRWSSSGHGLAVHDGVTVALHSRPPVLGGLAHINELEYAPAAHALYVQADSNARRDLTPAEARELAAWLCAVSSATRRAIE